MATAEALIRALATIHSRARVPRRFHPTFAERATHPSLARRIQAIRAAGGVAPSPIDPRAFAGDGVPRGVLFEAERIVFVAFGGERPDLDDLASLVLRAPHVDAIPYAELSSLHIERAGDRGGRWSPRTGTAPGTACASPAATWARCRGSWTSSISASARRPRRRNCRSWWAAPRRWRRSSPRCRCSRGV